MDKVTKAIKFAADAHDGMRRKKSDSPYILHPLEAAAIVGSITSDPDVISAALLHDCIEDAGISLQEIEEVFGNRVAYLVNTETEDKMAEIPPSDSWKIRKKEALEILRNADDKDVYILWLGDKLSNMRSFYKIWLIEGENMWQSFNQKNPDEQAWYYRSIAEITSPLKEYTVWQEYNKLVNIVFGKCAK